MPSTLQDTSFAGGTDENVTALLKTALEIATQTLREHSEFAPFAMAIRGNVLEGPIFCENDSPKLSQDILQCLDNQMNSWLKASFINTFGICANVITHLAGGVTRVHAVRITIQNSNGSHLNYYVPYELLPSGPSMKPWFTRA